MPKNIKDMLFTIYEIKFYNYVYITFCLSDSTKLEVYSLLHSTTTGTAEAQSHENELPYQLKLKETLSIQDKIVDLQKPTHESERCVLTRFCPMWKKNLDITLFTNLFPFYRKDLGLLVLKSWLEYFQNIFCSLFWIRFKK